MTSAPTFVVLGASNVARGLPWIVRGVRDRIGEPPSVLVANGRGRSYGVWAGVLGIARPGIVDCGVWDALPAPGDSPLDALVTDVGNDILYGSDPAVIARWIEACLERLRTRGARSIVLTGLPLERLRELGPREFGSWRRLLFPNRKLELERVRAAVEELQVRLAELAHTFDATWIVPPRPWYGLDPIHIRRAHFPAAWGALLAPCVRDLQQEGRRAALADPPELGLRMRLARGRSADVRFAGRCRTGLQPSVRCADGTAIALY